jgi:hypothetical protein
MNTKLKLALWELGCVLWVALAGSLLHFAFELTDYWLPMALIAAVNESAWEHTKMYFWPGLVWALVQFTYTRSYSNNYWFGKAMALIITPTIIMITYFGYMKWSFAMSIKPSLPLMLSIMIFGIFAGQIVSWKILASKPFAFHIQRYSIASYAVLLAMFSLLTFIPPKHFVFENFACYTYTGEYGILKDYKPYRIFAKVDAQGNIQEGMGMNYCANNPFAKAAVKR